MSTQLQRWARDPRASLRTSDPSAMAQDLIGTSAPSLVRQARVDNGPAGQRTGRVRQFLRNKLVRAAVVLEKYAETAGDKEVATRPQSGLEAAEVARELHAACVHGLGRYRKRRQRCVKMPLLTPDAVKRSALGAGQAKRLAAELRRVASGAEGRIMWLFRPSFPARAPGRAWTLEKPLEAMAKAALAPVYRGRELLIASAQELDLAVSRAKGRQAPKKKKKSRRSKRGRRARRRAAAKKRAEAAVRPVPEAERDPSPSLARWAGSRERPTPPPPSAGAQGDAEGLRLPSSVGKLPQEQNNCAVRSALCIVGRITVAAGIDAQSLAIAESGDMAATMGLAKKELAMAQQVCRGEVAAHRVDVELKTLAGDGSGAFSDCHQLVGQICDGLQLAKLGADFISWSTVQAPGGVARRRRAAHRTLWLQVGPPEQGESLAESTWRQTMTHRNYLKTPPEQLLISITGPADVAGDNHPTWGMGDTRECLYLPVCPGARVTSVAYYQVTALVERHPGHFEPYLRVQRPTAGGPQRWLKLADGQPAGDPVSLRPLLLVAQLVEQQLLTLKPLPEVDLVGDEATDPGDMDDVDMVGPPGDRGSTVVLSSGPPEPEAYGCIGAQHEQDEAASAVPLLAGSHPSDRVGGQSPDQRTAGNKRTALSPTSGDGSPPPKQRPALGDGGHVPTGDRQRLVPEVGQFTTSSVGLGTTVLGFRSDDSVVIGPPQATGTGPLDDDGEARPAPSPSTPARGHRGPVGTPSSGTQGDSSCFAAESPSRQAAGRTPPPRDV